ncbi:MAG: serine hydrolase domain-containing protein [Gemmatimonadota bacterium]
MRSGFLRLVALLGLVLAHRLPAQEAQLIARADSLAAALVASSNTPGLALVIMRGDRVLLEKGYGLANVELGVPVSGVTIFQSGSLGKMFTAAGVMHLVERGLIGLDEPVAKWLTNAPADWGGITVRHLLTHTSGIPDYTTDAFDYRRDLTEEEHLGLAYKVVREFPPGSRWNYSNTGYVLLGIIIHRASGMFYGDYLRQHIFGPSGMKTARVISEEDIIENRADGYRLRGGRLWNQEWVAPQLNTTADGSLYFSIRDLVAWARVVRSRAVLAKESWDRVLSPVKLASGRHYPYGFGWSVDTVAGQAVTSHGGAWQGFSTYFGRWNGDDLTVIALANRAGAPSDEVVARVAQVFNPALTPRVEVAGPDPDSRMVGKLRTLLSAIAAGRLQRSDFAYVRAGFFPATANRYREVFSPLGDAQAIELLSRRQVGDDLVNRHRVRYASGVVTVAWAVAPDGRYSMFSAQLQR